MNFLWHLRGSVLLDDSMMDDAVLIRIEEMLKKQWKPIAERGIDFVAFSDPLWRFFAPNWLAMVIYDEGVFWIAEKQDGRRLRYRLRCLHGFVFCLCVAVVIFAMGLVGGSFADGARFGGLAFAWLYGGNIVLALIRVPSLIQSTVAPARRR